MTNIATAFAQIARFLPFGLEIDDVVSVLAGAAAALAVVAVWRVLRIGDPFDRRLRGIKERQASLRAALMAPRRNRTRPVAGLARLLVQRLDLLKSKHAAEAQLLLLRAGFRTQDAMVTYLFCQLMLPTLLVVLVSIDCYWLAIVPVAHKYRVTVSLAALLLGFFGPRLYLRNIADKRYKNITRSLPDGLDLMVICAGAGLSLDGSLTRVSRELGKSWPDLAEELTLTSVELTFLQERRQALDNLMQRVDLPAIRAVVGTLQQTEKFGTPLVQSLRVLAAEFRDQRMMKAEEKGASLSVKLTLPMILCIMPALFIVLLGPAVLNVLELMRHHH